MSSEPISEEEMRLVAATFAEAGLTELSDLQIALVTLIQGTSAGSKRTALRKARAILKGGRVFALLESDPSFFPENLANEDAYRAASGNIAVVSLLYQAGSLPEYAFLIEEPPCAFTRLYLWMDFVHPMHPRQFPSQNPTGAIMSISSIFAGLSSAKPEVFLSSLRPNPRAMVLLLDIWLHHPSYMGVARVGRVEVAGALFLAVKSALEGFIGGGHEDIRAMFFTELRVLVGRRRHFLASIADQTRFLVVIGAISSKWTWIWTMQLLVAHLVTQSPEFYGVLVPRSFFRSIIGCVQSLLNGCTTQDEGLRGVVEKAGELMFDLLARTQDTRNTRRAIEAGLFSFLRASDAVFEARVKSVEALKTYLADCAVLPSILRTLAKVNNELVQETPQSELNGRFGRLFYNARWQWKWYVRLKEDNPWIRNMPCENLLKEDHQQQKRICPCGLAFYCSETCQREDWHQRHRYTCSAADGVWGLDGAITLEDARYIFCTAQAFITRNKMRIGMELRQLDVNPDPSHPTEKGLTRVLHIDLRSAPEPGTDFTFSVDTQRMQNEPGGPGSKVYIGVILSVAGKYPHLMLPMGYDMKFFPVNRYVPSPGERTYML